jgi:hypothetical protein
MKDVYLNWWTSTRHKIASNLVFLLANVISFLFMSRLTTLRKTPKVLPLLFEISWYSIICSKSIRW